MKSAIEDLVEFLDQKGWAYQQLDDKPAVQFGFDGDNGRWHCAAFVPGDAPCLVMLSHLPCRVTASRHRHAVAELLTRINYELNHGCFEMNFENGEVQFRTSLILENAAPAMEAIKHLVFSNLHIVDHFFGPVMAVVYGDATPRQALKQPAPSPARRFELN